MSEGSSFMNQLIRGQVREDDQREGEPAEPAPIGGRSDAGAGEQRTQPGSRDMNAWLRDAVQGARGFGV